MTKETGIIELETLVPLFIKDKDPEFGEGTYPIGDKIFLLDNDKLCKFLYDKAYDTEGNLREPGKDYVEFYGNFLARGEHGDELTRYNTFVALFGLEQIIDERRVPPGFQNRSIKYFLETTRLVNTSPRTAEPVVRSMAKGVTSMAAVGGGKKFIVNGLGTPYIPGSSIRGAVRNALLWTMLREDPALKITFDTFVQSRLASATDLTQKQKREFAQKFSTPPREVGLGLNALTASRLNPTFQGVAEYGDDYVHSYNTRWENASIIHRDLFRIVKISDATFVGDVQIEAIPVETYKLEPGNGGNVFQIKPNTHVRLNGVKAAVKARFRITIDKALAAEIFSGTIPQYLNSVPELLKALNCFFRAVATQEHSFFSLAPNSHNVRAVRQWYQEYRTVSGDDTAELPLLFRVGWGGGMMSKTQFLHLSDPDRKTVRNLTNNKGSAVAPKSRCLQVEEHNAVTPLGWCTLRYIGTDAEEFFHSKVLSVAEARQSTSRPQNCVKAIIVDASSSPAKIIVKEGLYYDTQTFMPKTLQCLQLTQGSELLVTLVITNGKLQKAEFYNTV
ncbi:MAG: type III-A CRISPR-associated RAMP protein Csm5 [Chlorobiaceae bacterium]|nr:type III-A CRISPR-associated RAMP protein Csm5 [Chlorobiaceae bacterium]